MSYIYNEHILLRSNQIISASEDGSVLLWDMRTRKAHNKLEPYNNSKVSRPDIGKWVGAATLGDDWIVSINDNNSNNVLDNHTIYYLVSN